MGMQIPVVAGIFLSSFLCLLPVPVQANVCYMLYQWSQPDPIGGVVPVEIKEDYEELVHSSLIQDRTLTTWMFVNPPSGRTQYLHYNHDIGNTVVKLVGSLDPSDPTTLRNFVKSALNDCIEKNSTEFFVTIEGQERIGVDLNVSSVTKNAYIKDALQEALDGVNGGPEKFDVLGFDTSCMSTLNAIDVYRDIAKYYLASETTEPHAGWDYQATDASTALNMANNFLEDYLNLAQYSTTQQTPKTIALVDTDKYSDFIAALSDLGHEMARLLSVDESFFVYLYRSREETLTFVNAWDALGDRSDVDIGAFLSNFRAMCNPRNDLLTLLNATEESYNNLFANRGVGPGSPPATGISLFWPTRDPFFTYQEFLEVYIFETPFAVNSTGLLEFFRAYYFDTFPYGNNVTSSCINNPDPGLGNNALIYSPTISQGSNGITFEFEIASSTEDAFVMYGVGLPTGLPRRLRGQSYTQTESALYLGNIGMSGLLNGFNYSSYWNGLFPVLRTNSSYDILYARDMGNSNFESSVMYFPNSSSIEDIEFPIVTSDGAELGGLLVTLSFSSSQSGFSLYYNGIELTPSMGGYFVAINPTLDLRIDFTYQLNHRIGGLGTVHSLSEVDFISLDFVTAQNFLDFAGLQMLSLTMFASRDVLNTTTNSSYFHLVDYANFFFDANLSSVVGPIYPGQYTANTLSVNTTFNDSKSEIKEDREHNNNNERTGCGFTRKNSKGLLAAIGTQLQEKLAGDC